MGGFLFPQFLTDTVQYRQAEALWLKSWQELAQRTCPAHRWESSWFKTTFVDGTACRDGNPIFSAVDPARRLGIRVIQFEPTGNTGEFGFWLNNFAKGEPEEIKELVISCSLTRYTLSVALDLMHQWMRTGSIRLGHERPDDPFLPDFEISPVSTLSKVA